MSVVVGCGQDKPVHYMGGFLRPLGRPAWRPNFWTAKINGKKYTGGQKSGQLFGGGPFGLKVGRIFGRRQAGRPNDRPPRSLPDFWPPVYFCPFILAVQKLGRQADRPNDRPFKGCPAYADTVTVSENFGRLSVRLYGSQHY
ncbi:hypothetical protein BpHYR1_027090 [Brachionus plicatilis]|uniref:Uncharacterized protein n=1 Tax=Brachionus plicatilis TaxID=10195 RepID=A0A3M7SFX1_BRAPC|nr:hypothetical protein BpHYR1_027090 [Brachionus plicatilis]